MIRLITKRRSWARKLHFLFELENRLYSLEGEAAVGYGNGVHPKHRLMKYHFFFKSHINTGDSVLDVGCGNAELAYDIVQSIEGSTVLGVDINENKIALASRSYIHPNLTLKVADALCIEEWGKCDVVILSNVLEHIDKRIDLLTVLAHKTLADRFLIRVPLFDRDWRVPLKKELGVDYRLDPTHYIEYTIEGFNAELHQGGLAVADHSVQWGELWCVAKKIEV